ncbi:MAG: LicD family protein [Methyloceanibacter sp.]|nr:LicD family protein [Methyloceanibacter sp.]
MDSFYQSSAEAGMHPFLMWGTLLGCVREGRLLPNDHDIDVGILADDYANRDRLIAAMRKRGYRLAFEKDYKLRFQHPASELRMDVDVLYRWNGRMITSETTDDGRIIATHFPLDAFHDLKEVVFLDVRVLIPEPPEPVLAWIYGDWRTPVGRYRSGRDLCNRLQLVPGEPRPCIPSSPHRTARVLPAGREQPQVVSP